MDNKDLIQYLHYQIDKKKKRIGENNVENLDLRMECQHLECAIKRLQDANCVKDEVKE